MMLYDPFFTKSFNRYERKRLVRGALILCFIATLSVCSTFKRRFHPLSVCDSVNLQLSIRGVENILISTTNDSNPTVVGTIDQNLQSSTNTTPQNMRVINDADTSSQPIVVGNQNLQTSTNTTPQNTRVLNNANTSSQPIAIETKKMEEPLCRILRSNADYCELEGDVRVDPDSSTLFLVRPRSTISESTTTSWTIKPYPRRGISNVKNWTVTLISDNDNRIPSCTKNHTLPAVLFSIGGYTGNHFHDFADLIFPLFTTSSRFESKVHFLLSDYKPWWPNKFRGVLGKLTRYELVNIDNNRGISSKHVECYEKVTAGLRFHKELVDSSSSSSMPKFREFLRQAYSLERTKRARNRTRPPRLMIVSRKRTGVLTNEDEVSRAARRLGYEVILAEARMSTDMGMFGRVVNTCDVLMGVHGAGLTNMLFLPDGAVVIQVVPMGGIDKFARLDFGEPAAGMNVRYLEYKINAGESSLGRRNPVGIRKKGWDEIKSVYLDNQNMTIDVRRFKGTLAKALKILRH